MSEPEEKASDPSLGTAVSTQDEVTNGRPKTELSNHIVFYPRVLLSKV